MTDEFAQAFDDKFAASVIPARQPKVFDIPAVAVPSAADMPEPSKPKSNVTEKQLMLDPRFAAAARDVHLLFEGEPFEGDDQMAARYGIDAIGEFNYNFAGGTYMPNATGAPGTIQAAALLTSGSQDQAKAFVYLLDRYDELPNFTLAGTARMIRGAIADPSIYTGFGTLGLGFAARKTGAMGIKKALVEIAKRPGTSAAVYTGIEAGAADQLTQGIEKQAGYDIDPVTGALRTGISAVVGGAAGGGLVKGGEMLARELAPVIKEGVDQLGQAAEARMAERGPMTGRLMSGGDPMDVIDPAITAVGKLARGEPEPVPQAMPDVIDLTPEERSASLIDDLYDGETTLEAGGNLYDVAKRINERSKSLGVRSEPTPENQTKIAKVIAREALHAMKSKGNAGDWYRQKVDNAMRIAERVYSEVSQDPNKANAIKFITAITSNGASVPENSKNTFAVFDEYLKTGKMPDIGYGKETNAMKKAFELHNNLVDEMGETEFYDFMSQEFTVRELDQIGKKYGFSVSGEAKDTKLPASVIFGPKIGGGFYQNLQGNYKPLTMDRWFMRTWGRYTGGLIVEQSPQAAAKQMDRIRNSVTPETAAEYGYDYNELLSDDILLQELAYRAHKDYVKSGYKAKTDLNKSSKNFVEAQKKVLEQPRTGTERNYMRATVDEALDLLRQQGVELDRAALQALIWYPEKELYAKLGIGTKRSAPTDYETEFANVARERGIDVSDITGNAQP